MKILENTYRQDYPNLIQCFKRNTYQLPLIKAELRDIIEEEFEEIKIDNQYIIDTNLQFEKAEIFKSFYPEALNEALFQNANILRKFGRIRSLTSKGNFLAVGSNLGAVLNFFIGSDAPNKAYQEIKSQLLYAAEVCQTEYGSVNQLSFNTSQSQLAIGFDNGIIGIYDMINIKNIKWVKIHQIRIIALTYVNENSVVSGDEQGNCFITRTAKGRLFYDVDSQFIIKSQPMSFIRSLPLKCKGIFNYPEYTIFALGNGYKCWVLRILDANVTQFTILADFTNDGPENNQCILEWDIAKLDGKDRLFFGVSWTNQTRTYLFLGSEYVEGKIRANFRLFKEIKLQANLIYMNSIYNDLVLLLSEKGIVYTSNFTNFKFQKIIAIDKFDPVPLMYWRDNKYESQFSVCVSNNESLQEIYILTNQNVMVLKYYNFEEKIRHFMENQQFLICFQLLLCMHKKVFMDFDRQKLLQLSSQIVDLYTKQIARLFVSNKAQEAKERGISLIKFILEIQSEQSLNQICDLLTKTLNDSSAFFFSIVEPFILNKQFKFIPDEALLKIFSCIKTQRGKINLLLNQLDLSRVSQSVYLQACLENSLFQPMIKLCTHSAKNEFLTPLFQIWSHSYKQSQLENFEEEISTARKAISFMELLLKGKLQNDENMPSDIHKKTIEMMIVWIFEEKNLERLIWIDPYGAFDILYQIFSLSAEAQIEFGYDEHLITIYKVIKKFINPTYRWRFQQQDFELEKQIYDLLGTENYEIQTSFSFFIIKIIFMLKLNVEFDLMMDVLLFCTFNKSFLFFIDYRSYAEVIEKTELAELEKHHSHSDIIEYFQQRLMLKFVHILVNQKKTNKHIEQIELLNGFQDLKEIPLVQAFLFSYMGEYLIPVQIYLRSENILIQKQVFKYLHDTLHLVIGKDVYITLNQSIMSRLYDLINMDIKKTRDLICQFQKDNELQVIDKLNSNKNLQLKYIETIIRNDLHSDQGLQNSILIKHIELLCELQPDNVLVQLQKFHYPLEDVLEICKQYKNVESTAYILERLGFIPEAVTLQFSLLNQLINNVQGKIKNFDQINNLEFEKIDQKMNQISSICSSHSENPEQSWYYYLDNLINLNNQIEENQINSIIINKIGKLFEVSFKIIQEIAVHTPLELFAVELGSKYHSLNIKEYKGNFIRMLNTFYYQHYFIQNVKFIIQTFFNVESRHFLAFYKQGFYTENYCDICNKLIDQRGYKFLCGHFIHIECKLKEHQVCSKCMQSEKFFLEQTVQKQKQRINRMKNEEQMKQFDSLQLNPSNYSKTNEPGEKVLNSAAKLQLFDILRDKKMEQRIETDIEKLMIENL